MGFLSGFSKDDKVRELENEAQERIQRIGKLRAQISTLTAEEAKVRQEFEERQQHTEELQKRKKELASLKEEETELARDVQQRESILSELKNNLQQLQATRSKLVQQTAMLRSQVSNEEKNMIKVSEEHTQLNKKLSEHEAKKKKILEDTAMMEKVQNELVTLENGYNQIQERIPVCRKKYEQTKLLMEELKNNTDPVFQAILKIWQKLPEDVLDKRLVLSKKQ